jgi:hypothetical protein
MTTIRTFASLLCLLAVSCSLREPLNVDLSPRPIGRRLAACLAQWGVDPITQAAPELKRCLADEIRTAAAGGPISIVTMRDLGFYCDGATEPRCVLVSWARSYRIGFLGPNKTGFADTVKIVMVTFRDGRMTTLSIVEDNVTTDDGRVTNRYGPNATNDAVP